MTELSAGQPAQRLRIYISEEDRWRGLPLYTALLEELIKLGMTGATVLRGVAGFGAASRFHAAARLESSTNLPLVVEVVDTPPKIAQALECLYPMVGEGLITREEVQVLRYTQHLLNPLPADRLVSEVMTGKVVTLAPSETIEAAWKRMLEHGLKVLPVVDAQGRPLGILTDEDLMDRGGLRQHLSAALRLDPALLAQELGQLRALPLLVANVMTSPVVTVPDSETLGFAAIRMVKSGLKRLPVVDSGGRLVGILSRLDLLRQAAKSAPALAPFQPPNGAERTVGEVMAPGVPVVDEKAPLPELVEAFAASNSHRLVVVDERGRCVGLVSDSDVVTRLEPARQGGILDAIRKRGRGRPPAGPETAAGLMSPGPLTASPGLPVTEAVSKMLNAGRKWLVVVDSEGRPLGLVDRQALLVALAAVFEQ